MARIDRKLEQRLVNVEQLVASRTPDPAMPAPGPTPAQIREARQALYHNAALTPEERSAWRNWWSVVEAGTREAWGRAWDLFARPGLTLRERQAFADYLMSIVDIDALEDEDTDDPSGAAGLLGERDREAIREVRIALRGACASIDDHTTELADRVALKADAAWERLSPEERRYIDHWRDRDFYWRRFLGDEEAP